MSKKNIIGKRVRLQIGGESPKDNDYDAIIGEDVTVHVPAEDVGKYDSIIGEKVELTIGDDIDQIVQNILQTVQNPKTQRHDEIIAVCKNIIEEKDRDKKLHKISTLIKVGAEIATITQFIIQLKALLPS